MASKKPTLTLDDVKHVAKLANLSLKLSELKKFQKQLSSVLDYVSQLSKVNTQRVEPTSQVPGLENVFRQDQVRPSLNQEQATSGGKQIENGLFKVKSIFK